MKHPLIAAGIVGAVVSVTSARSLYVEDYLEVHTPQMPHFGRNTEDYRAYLQEHDALLYERELRALRSYNCGASYTREFGESAEGTQTFVYTDANTFALYLPNDILGTSFMLYTGAADGFGDRYTNCTKDKERFICEPSHAFSTPCTIRFLQGDDPFKTAPDACTKQKMYTEGLRVIYTSLEDTKHCRQ